MTKVVPVDITTAGPTCPLCCNEFSKADVLYPIHCPTTQCHFQYCMNCIESLINSSNDGYTEASDGSYQVKVSIRCPMCRAPYRLPNHHTTLGVAISPTAASNAIVCSILKLRQAASIPIPSATHNTNSMNNNTNDSDLSASQLAQRNHFIMNSASTTCASGSGSIGRTSTNTTTMIIKELKDAITTVQQYYDSIDHKDCGTVPSLPWEDWEQYIQTLQRQEQQQQKLQLSNMSISSNHHKSSGSDEVEVTSAVQPQSALMISRDPTLFMGLDELLTYDEQEFITHMFISGDAELIAQAANLLYSIMCNMMSQQSHSQPPKDANNNNTTTTKANTTKKQKTMAQLDHEQKIRKKFPLPNHMPRVVTIHPYNPLNCKNPPIKFVPPPKQSSRQPPRKKDSPIIQKSDDANNTTAAAATVTVTPTTTTASAATKQISPSTIASSHTTDLTLASVNGIAGRVGLRRGDIITHVNNERVSTFSEYTIAVQYALEQQEQQIPLIPEHRHGQQPQQAAMTITVNANADVAQQLLRRAQQMQQQNVRFHC